MKSEPDIFSRYIGSDFFVTITKIKYIYLYKRYKNHIKTWKLLYTYCVFLKIIISFIHKPK